MSRDAALTVAVCFFGDGASNAGYHYLGCGKTMALIGQAFAEAIIEMEK